MEHNTSANVRQNLIFLRRHLKISQGEFIRRFLTDKDGKKIISVTTLSGLENGIVSNPERVLPLLLEKIPVDEAFFYQEPDEFANRVDPLLEHLPAREESGIKEITTLIQKKSAVESIVQVISDYIIDGMMSGKLKAGGKLPSDREFAEKLGVSRGILREALKVLDVMGLVNILHGQGTFIANNGANFLMIPLSWSFLVGGENLDDLLLIRDILERASAKQAAIQRANGKDFSLLQENFEMLTQLVESGNLPIFMDKEISFHIVIANLCGSATIGSLLDTIRRITQNISATGLTSVDQMIASHREHAAIYTAIMAGDPDWAEAAMVTHLKNTKERIRLPNR